MKTKQSKKESKRKYLILPKETPKKQGAYTGYGSGVYNSNRSILKQLFEAESWRTKRAAIRLKAIDPQSFPFPNSGHHYSLENFSDQKKRHVNNTFMKERWGS